MAQARSLENEAIFGCTQVLLYLEQAQLAADQLGDKASVALIETLQRLYRVRADSRGELASAPERAAQRAAPVESLDVYLFGPSRVFLSGKPIGGWRKKSEALFNYLVFHRAAPIHRDQLLDLFWPDAQPQSARNCLNVTLHALRRTLETSDSLAASKLIHFANEHYSFLPALGIWTDVDAFNGHLTRGQAAFRAGDRWGAISHYELAAAFYTGDFLEGDRYEEWTISPRERLRISYLALLIDLGQLYGEVGNHTAALECSRKILDLDDCHEDAYRQLMRSYYALGQRGLALRQYHVCRETLERELGVTPMQETISVYEQIRNGSDVNCSEFNADLSGR